MQEKKKVSLEYLALQPGEVIDAHSVFLPTDRHKDVLPLQHLHRNIIDLDQKVSTTSPPSVGTFVGL